MNCIEYDVNTADVYYSKEYNKVLLNVLNWKWELTQVMLICVIFESVYILQNLMFD